MTLQQASTRVVAFCLFLVGGAIAVQAQSDHVSYDKHGRVTTIRYANGQEVRYEYDDRNNLTTVTNVVSSVDEAVETPAVWIHPNPASDHTTVTVPAVAGTAVTFTLTTLQGRLLWRRQVLADEVGQAVLAVDAQEEGLSPGMYQVGVATTAGRTSTALTIAR